MNLKKRQNQNKKRNKKKQLKNQKKIINDEKNEKKIRRGISSNNLTYENKKTENKKSKINNVNTINKTSVSEGEKIEVKKNKLNLRVVFSILTIFILAFIILYRESRLDVRAKEIARLKDNIKKIEKENSQIELSLKSASNLSNIQKIAVEKLGMKKMSNSNTVKVEIDVEDSIEPVVVTKIEREETNFFKKIYNNILDFFGKRKTADNNIKIKEEEKTDTDDTKEEEKADEKTAEVEVKPEETKEK